MIIDPYAEVRSRVHGGALTTYTLAITTAVTGTWSYDVDGKIVQYPATVPPDAEATVAAALAADHVAKPEVLRLANVKVDPATPTTVDIFSRSINTTFVVDNLVFPVGGAATLTDTTPTKVDIPPGVAVALLSENEIRVLASGDTESNFFGIAGFQPANDMRLYTGDNLATDAYAPASVPQIQTKGEIPVIVEDGVTVAIGDPVYVRKVATGSEVLGSFRISVDGTDTFQLTRARWTSPNYPDSQGRNVALLTVNAP
jgi:hypothetical protein